MAAQTTSVPTSASVKRERSASPDAASADAPTSARSAPEAKRVKDERKMSANDEKPAAATAATGVKEEKDAVELTTAGAEKEEAAGASAGVEAGENGDKKTDASAAAAGGAEGEAGTAGAAAGEAAGADGLEPQHIAMRSLIVTGDASVIIGKQGRHINEIRDKSGARLTISESIPGNPERIMTVAGQLDAVSKAFGLIVRRINDEPFDQPSVPGSRAVTIRFIVPNSRMGSVIGKQGTKIKEIQEASGARLTAGEAMLPGSTERVLSISGVADAVHIAVYYVGTILIEHPDRNANNMTYRPSGASTAAASAIGGGGGPGGAGGPPAQRGGFAGAAPGPSGAPGYGAYPGQGAPPQAGGPQGGAPSYGSGPQLPPGSQTQQIFIPNDLVGCIIGKGGQKINEIRQMSGSHIKIMEPGAGIAAGGSGTERLVTITGPPANIQLAVSLLYQRLEQEKMRLAQTAQSPA